MTGQDILDLGNSHVGETYQLGVLYPKIMQDGPAPGTVPNLHRGLFSRLVQSFTAA